MLTLAKVLELDIGTSTGTDDAIAEPERVTVVAEKDVDRLGDVNNLDAPVELSEKTKPDPDRDESPSA